MDYYKILNISNNASQKEIKQSWRKLSMIHHPDRNNGVDTELYKNINAAYDILSDSEKRKQYDMEQSVPSFLKNNGPFEFMNINPEDIFKIVFNNTTQIPFQQNYQTNFKKKHTTRITQTVTLKDLYNRKTFNVSINNIVNNITEVDEVTFNVDGHYNDGDIIKTKSKNYNDVEIYIKLLHHDEFKKDGINVIYEKKITLLESLTGFSFKFNYLDDQEYTINNNIKIIHCGYIKSIKNMGLYSSGKKGNFIIVFDVEFPEILTDEQKEEIKKILN